MEAGIDVKPLSGSSSFSEDLLHLSFAVHSSVMKMKCDGQAQTGLAIIGLGRVGSTLARVCLKKGIPVRVMYDSDPDLRGLFPAQFVVERTDSLEKLDQCGIVLMPVPDSSIDDAAHQLLATGRISSGTILAHTSGVHEWNPSLLQRWTAIRFASMHPLMAFPSDSSDIDSFCGIGFGLTGDSDSLAELSALVKLLEGLPFHLPAGHRALYHAAAVFASNFPVVLFGIALDLMKSAGVPESEVSTLLAGLMKSTVLNLEKASPLKALSGPASRKDLDTVRKHLTAVMVDFPDYAPLYNMMSGLIRNWIETGEIHGDPNGTRIECRDPDVFPDKSSETIR